MPWGRKPANILAHRAWGAAMWHVPVLHGNLHPSSDPQRDQKSFVWMIVGEWWTSRCWLTTNILDIRSQNDRMWEVDGERFVLVSNGKSQSSVSIQVYLKFSYNDIKRKDIIVMQTKTLIFFQCFLFGCCCVFIWLKKYWTVNFTEMMGTLSFSEGTLLGYSEPSDTTDSKWMFNTCVCVDVKLPHPHWLRDIVNSGKDINTLSNTELHSRLGDWINCLHGREPLTWGWCPTSRMDGWVGWLVLHLPY